MPPSVKLPPLVSKFMTSQSSSAPDKPVFRFNVSMKSPVPPLREDAPARDVPKEIFKVSAPAPSAMLPVTTEPAAMVTTALPAPSIIASPFADPTVDVDNRLISTARPAFDRVSIPARTPPSTAPETVNDSIPVPLFWAKIPYPRLDTEAAEMVKSVLAALRFSALIPFALDSPTTSPVEVTDNAPVPKLLAKMPLIPPDTEATEMVKSVPAVLRFSA